MFDVAEKALDLILFPADDELLFLDPHTTQTHFPFDSEGFKPSVCVMCMCANCFYSHQLQSYRCPELLVTHLEGLDASFCAVRHDSTACLLVHFTSDHTGIPVLHPR